MVSQSALVGGIAIGVFTVLFVLLFYMCLVHGVRRPKANRSRGLGRDVELGRAAPQQQQAPPPPPPPPPQQQQYIQAPQPVYAAPQPSAQQVHYPAPV